jgi:hypothetical protein
VSGHIPEDTDQSSAWEANWEQKFAKSWRIANDYKYYPRRPVQVERKDLDELDIATVR